MKYKAFFIFFCLFLLQLGIGVGIMYAVSFHSVQNRLHQVIARIHEDVAYHDGNWDTTAYNADPQAPGAAPLYILTTDGFVIDRWKPIHGFLDVSDFKHLLVYTTPQTIHTVAKQDWRIYSRPILSNNKPVGVITVSLYNPQEIQLTQIDNKLTDAADYIAKYVKVGKNEDVTVENLDDRNLSFDVAFQVVNQFNTIKAKNNNNNSIDRIPNFIDTSYVAKQLEAPSLKQVTDTQTNETYLLASSPIYGSDSNPVGVIVAGQSVSYIYQLLTTFVLFTLPGSLILAILSALFSPRLLRPLLLSSAKKKITQILFSKKESILYFDNQSVSIPYATNQYVLCKTLCSFPSKRFEVDELLEKFGEESASNNSRKVYDAMNLLNKKTSQLLSEKFIINKDKTYQINPVLATKVSVK